MSFAEAASIPVEFGTAHDCLFEFGNVRAGETVLVQGGAGGVGLPAIQLAKQAGATVIATASDDSRLERLRQFGLDVGINYTACDVAAEVMRLTDGRGADLVVDPVGGHTLEVSIDALAYRGRISWVGNAGDRAGEVRPNVWRLMEKNATLTALFLAMEMSRNPQRVHDMIADLIDRVASNELQVVIDRTFPLSAAAEAHLYAETASRVGRILIVPDQT
jgi:NADPH2:quinone reductase